MTQSLAPTLFEKTPFGKGELQSKVVMAPMTRVFSPDGVPTEEVAAYYKRRAEHGVGLIVTEGTAIDHPAAVMHKDIPRFYGEKALAGWKHVVDEVHSVGGKIIPQLWHIGSARKQGNTPNEDAPPVSPSGLAVDGSENGIALTKDELKSIIRSFAQAAADAERIGFDGIELHGAHGYLIDQFLWERTNQRTDEYGGDLEGRTRFAVEVVKACREVVSRDFPIVFRFSQWKGGVYDAKLARTPEELKQLLMPLAEAGVDIFHCSTRRIWEAEFEGVEPLNLAAWTKQVTGKPVISVGSLGVDYAFLSKKGNDEHSIDENLRLVDEKLQAKEFDFVAVGRALLADPEWAEKIRDGKQEDAILYTKEAEKTLY
ncbi:MULTISPECIES: NADH:flavin oxidoreductase [Bacillaceae]|uniref:1,2-oxophytodienoate reductase n=1 Tax=Alkalicoccobacillus plakortidis TaxID=444060 RepID=A0A9D5DKF9_9BACI|nr:MULTISPECIES: NADH:flavin oxidoreductase [Bacillaceae]KQL55579.1 1,2-oxophytodienoate reductase [Alkalicoccobacillus plakortidis]